ncbi:MAG: secondary thiamine-phosphate synthase enzyme YjbQ [Planctomycetota bacterium]|jgi:secondary thiamine-phosphate synthase enzyme|nr:secondary thiamine-phosphate synthase enzyme YjbQ [Planctomycetota bacterium]
MERSEYSLATDKEGLYDITSQVREAVAKSGVMSGLCHVFSPHTTAGISINENSDPDVVTDILLGLKHAFPDQPAFRHSEGNSAAHLKASAVGSGVILAIADGRLVLGTWQAVFFCEFDGPRHRHFQVNIL